MREEKPCGPTVDTAQCWWVPVSQSHSWQRRSPADTHMHNILALENRLQWTVQLIRMNTLKRRVPLINVCADSIPYGWAYLVLSRLGKPSRLKPGMKSMGFVTSRRAPPGGTLTTWAAKDEQFSELDFYMLAVGVLNVFYRIFESFQVIATELQRTF